MRHDKTGHMRHAFGSIAIIQELDVHHLDDTSPQVPIELMSAADFLPSKSDWQELTAEYAILMARVAAKKIPALQFLEDTVPDYIEGPDSERLAKKSTVVSLPVLFKNEQKYEDVTDIMKMYEDEIQPVYHLAQKELNGQQIHIGGDQLARERFSGAKRLRIGAGNAYQGFQHLGPITFELFHRMMNLLQLMFRQLFKESSAQEIGTMKSVASRIQRTNVDLDVRKAYQADRDFTMTFVDAYIVEAVLHHFGMEDKFSQPSKNVPPTDPLKWKEWMTSEFHKLITSLVLNTPPNWTTN